MKWGKQMERTYNPGHLLFFFAVAKFHSAEMMPGMCYMLITKISQNVDRAWWEWGRGVQRIKALGYCALRSLSNFFREL